MHPLDYAVIALFFAAVAWIGWSSARKIRGSRDYFVAGGTIPWWLGGISHHVSGHSGVVFVAYAAVAYQYGFTLYVWWAFSIGVSCLLGAWWFAPRWARLRIATGIESPTEYLAARYNRPTQHLVAWSGALLKVFDVGAKWASIGVLMHGFTGLPVAVGIGIAGGVSLFYITVGGLWADLQTDLLQFAVQVVAGIVLFVAVLGPLGGAGAMATLWERLPAGHGQLFNGPYSGLFFAGYFAASLLSYNGGTWNLAVRYIGSPSARSARHAAWLSGALYLGWPLVLFFPMWAAPVLLPGLADPSQAYVLLTQRYLPTGLIGLVMASMFAATMAMTTSDTNTVSSVITRDILPTLSRRCRNLDQRQSLRLARWTTLGFTLLTIVIGLEAERFGGVLGLILTWFAALIGPVSVPMILGLLPCCRGADARVAIAAILTGFGAFVLVTQVFSAGTDVRMAAPIASSAAVFLGLAWIRRHQPVPAAVAHLLAALSNDGPSPPQPASHAATST